MPSVFSTLSISTTWGDIVVDAQAGKVVRCTLPYGDMPPKHAFKVKSSRMKALTDADRATLSGADAFVRDILAGKPGVPPRVLIPDGTPLQRMVWTYLSRMKPRQYVTYGQLAKAVGHDRAARAIGQACGANPIPLFIPCHRVVGAGGNAGGFSGGMAWKYLLVEKDTGRSLPELMRIIRLSQGKSRVSRRVA